jgi:chromosome segregation ATPase
MNISKLSSAARTKVQELEQAIQQVMDHDAQREPNLTDQEQAEITALQARIAEIAPRLTIWQEELLEKRERYNKIKMAFSDILFSGDASADDLAGELVRLEKGVYMLDETNRTYQHELIVAEARIDRIKGLARDREAGNVR